MNLLQNHHHIIQNCFPLSETIHFFQPLEHRILTSSLTAYQCKSKYANGTIVYKSDFSFIPLGKNIFFALWI